MALTKLNGFTGEAEILGALLVVEFRDASLTFRGVTLEDTSSILDALSTKQLAAVRLPTPEGAAPVLQEYVPPDEAAAKAPKAARAKKGAGESEHKADAAEVAPPFEVSAPVKDAPKKAEAKEEKKVEANEDSGPRLVKSAAQGEDEAVPSGVIAMPEEIAKSGRFFVIMKWAQTAYKIPSTAPDRIAEVLAKYQEHPAIRRTRDLKEKVASTLMAFDESGGV